MPKIWAHVLYFICKYGWKNKNKAFPHRIYSHFKQKCTNMNVPTVRKKGLR